MGDGAPDDCITDTTSNKLGKCDRGRPQTWTTLKTLWHTSVRLRVTLYWRVTIRCWQGTFRWGQNGCSRATISQKCWCDQMKGDMQTNRVTKLNSRHEWERRCEVSVRKGERSLVGLKEGALRWGQHREYSNTHKQVYMWGGGGRATSELWYGMGTLGEGG